MARRRKTSDDEEALVQAPSRFGSGAGLNLCSDSERLLTSGDAHPQWVWRNLCDFGKACPKDDYVQSPEGWKLSDLAAKWGVGNALLETWSSQQNWPQQRLRAWNKVVDASWKEEAKALMDLSKREVAGQRERWERLRIVLEHLLIKGTITEQTATGQIYERDFSPKDVKDVSMALQTCDENIARTYGYQRTNLQRQVLAANAESAPVETRVRKVRHVFTVEETTPIAALPAHEDSSPVEGIVIE